MCVRIFWRVVRWRISNLGTAAALTHESLLLFTWVVVIHQHSGLGSPSLVIICQAFAPIATMETHAVQHASFDADWGSLV